MKITGVGAVPLAIPLAPSTPESSWAAGIGKQILVRVTTDSDLIGWGECFAYGAPLAVCNVVDDALAPLVVGQDPTEIERLTQVMHRALMIWGRRGLAICAVSGVELALWDLAGKSQRVPVHRLLGGLSQLRVRAYASLLRYDTASDVGRMCRAMVGQGYTAIKLHQVDVESVAAAREAVGDGVDLMLTRTARGPSKRRSGSDDCWSAMTCAGSRSRSGRRRTTPASPECVGLCASPSHPVRTTPRCSARAS